MNKKFDLDAMSVDEMWRLHEKIGQLLVGPFDIREART